MFSLPTPTEIKKQLPKKAIFAKCDLTAQQRNAIDADIARVDIVGFVSPDTIKTIAPGKEVSQFYIFTAQLKHKDYNRKSIELLFKAIPQRIILALQFEGQTQLAAYHTKLITAQWMPTEAVTISLSGLNLDSAWDNIVATIGSIDVAEGNSLTEQIRVDDQRAKTLAQIIALERQMRSTAQPRRQRELYAQIKNFKLTINNNKNG